MKKEMLTPTRKYLTFPEENYIINKVKIFKEE